MAPLHVLAHEGGWDEILMVAGPVAVFAGLLLLARKRAQDLNTARDEAEREEAEREDAGRDEASRGAPPQA